jgi:hypothetical protein
MTEVIELVVSAALQIYLTFWLIRRDERRLTGLEAARTFLPATFWVAVVVFGPLSIPIHFVRTRRSLSGLMLGLLWLVAVLGLITLAGLILGTILE